MMCNNFTTPACQITLILLITLIKLQILLIILFDVLCNNGKH